MYSPFEMIRCLLPLRLCASCDYHFGTPYNFHHMPIRCFCDECGGSLVSRQTKFNHQRKNLKTQTISGRQLQRGYEVFPAAQHIAGPSSLAAPIHLRPPSGVSVPPLDVSGLSGTSDEPGSLAQASTSVSDLDAFTNLIYDTAPGFPSNSINVNPEYIDVHEGEYIQEDDDDFPDEDAILDDADLDDDSGHSISPTPLASDPTEDNPDPFVVEALDRQGNANLQEIPIHLLVVYTMITWLHFQFHLPYVACNAVLAFLALIFKFFNLAIALPFITLQSATRALGADPGIILLAVCPKCRSVYPSSGSRHMQDTCTTCQVALFLPEHTRRGHHRTIKTPVIKYPYLPLSEQIVSILKNPGVESLLDDWRTKPRKAGEYSDIFDGRMCRLKLRAPDGSLFFSNRPHERNGPNDELRIGVNMGVDWYVLYLILSDLNNPSLGFLIFVATSHLLTRRVRLRFRSATYHLNFGMFCHITR
jgi:hypothetical protein